MSMLRLDSTDAGAAFEAKNKALGEILTHKKHDVYRALIAWISAQIRDIQASMIECAADKLPTEQAKLKLLVRQLNELTYSED